MNNREYPGEAGLLRMQGFVAAVEKTYGAWPFKVVHVAGTSGKGSVVVTIARILESYGKKVGAFISPYVMKPEEQIQVNGENISIEDSERLAQVVASFGPNTPFERLVMRAMLYFKEKGVDVVILETGVGGLYDATNAFSSDMSVITPISVDHERLLGKTIEEIATHKAGIIKLSNVGCIMGNQKPSVGQIIEAAAAEKNVPTQSMGKEFSVEGVKISEGGTDFRFVSGDFNERFYYPLIGYHQAQNAAIAIAAANVLYPSEIQPDLISQAFQKVSNPGRFEIVEYKNKKIIMDVAHNPAKIESLVSTFQELWNGEKATIVLACKWTKDIGAMARLLIPISAKVIVTSFDNGSHKVVNRPMPEQQIREAFRKGGYDGEIEIEHEAGKAFQKSLTADSHFIIATGSFHLVRLLDLA